MAAPALPAASTALARPGVPPWPAETSGRAHTSARSLPSSDRHIFMSRNCKEIQWFARLIIRGPLVDKLLTSVLLNVETAIQCMGMAITDHMEGAKVLVLKKDRAGWLQFPYGWVRDATEIRSLDIHQSMTFRAASKQLSSALSRRLDVSITIPYFKTSPFSYSALLLGYFQIQTLRRGQISRQQVWLGYWTGPEDVDGWGFVEAFLVPS